MIIDFDDLKDIHPVHSFSFVCITPSLIFEEDTDFSLNKYLAQNGQVILEIEKGYFGSGELKE